MDGITYDDAVYRVWVEITDDLKGQLHATVHIYDDEGIPQDKISFVNIYQVTGDASVTLSGDKIIDGRDWKEDDRFTVELYEADENFNPTETPKMSAEMDATTRSYTLSLDYTEADVGKTFYYVLTEKDCGATINGLTYSSAVYQIKVVVEDDGKGGVVTTVVIVDATASSLHFVNEYNADPVSVVIEGTKILNGRDIEDGEFKFMMLPADAEANVLEGATAMVAFNASSKFTFDALTFTEVGTYHFVIYEDATVKAERVSYDETVYFVTIEVTDDQNGKLMASTPVITKQGSDEISQQISFTNVFVPKPHDLTVDLHINKTVVNKGTDVIGPEDFEFLLSDLSGEGDSITVKSDQDGKAMMTLIFTEADVGKTYSYKISEINTGRENVVYSDAEYTITITISLDEATNALTATLTLNETAVTELVAEFENVYEANLPPTPPTGDSSNLATWIAMMLVSGGAALTLFSRGKKKRSPIDL